MESVLLPLKADSLKDVFVSRFEHLILSGEVSIGQRLPSERELALRLGVSRPVVHEGLVELAARGLVTMKPRVGTVVNDYRQEGSLALLTSLVNYHDGRLEPQLFRSMLEMRQLFEVETARLAACHRTEAHLEEFRSLLLREETMDSRDLAAVTEIDFAFHHLIAMASGNQLYPLLMNSFKQVYTNLAGTFFTEPGMPEVVFGFHREFTAAVEEQDEPGAERIMSEMLAHGRRHLEAMTVRNRRRRK